ncbi:MAG: hypothetical protein IJS46_05680, partial [Kiritimatiellae bacterium]|nr:hypothetical protein [Kiritimatiellia bacterium]
MSTNFRGEQWKRPCRKTGRDAPTARPHSPESRGTKGAGISGCRDIGMSLRDFGGGGAALIGMSLRDFGGG